MLGAFRLAERVPADGAKATLLVSGPGAQISPSWYTARFPGQRPDRSRTAPTYNYVNATLSGTLQTMSEQHLAGHALDS